MTVQIQIATEIDLPEILSLYAQPDMDNGRVLPLLDTKKLFNKIQTYPNYHLYVAKLTDGKIVGSFALLIMDNLGHLGTPSGIIEDVVVDPQYQGMGIGKQMLQVAMQICKENKCYKLVLSSNLKRERAHKFYEDLGFKQHGISFIVELS